MARHTTGQADYWPDVLLARTTGQAYSQPGVLLARQTTAQADF